MSIKTINEANEQHFLSRYRRLQNTAISVMHHDLHDFEKLKVMHLDLVLLNVIQFSVASVSQIANKPLIAFADGAIRIKLSALQQTGYL